MRIILWTTLMLAMSLVLVACEDQAQKKPAPPGDHAVLEQLADAYRNVSQQYPMQPQAMPPKGRRDFLNQVFQRAGYSYSATLITLAQSDIDAANQEQRDLVELLLLPIKGVADGALDELYTDDEGAAVRRLRRDFQ